jgi:hypothetical protein
LVVFLFSAACASAQVVFSITATADATGYGYTSGNSYTFNFTMDPNAGKVAPPFVGFSGLNSFGLSSNRWGEDSTNNYQIFTDVTGSGIAGTFARATTPYTYVGTENIAPAFFLSISSQDTSNWGLKTLDNSTVIYNLDVQVNTSASFTFPGSYTNAGTYFSSFLGALPNPGGTIYFRPDALNSFATFTITSATLSAVPEPATYAALAGIGAFGLVILRRRRA